MKKQLLLLITLLLSTSIFAQTSGFNYKALVTDNGTALNTQTISLKFTVLQNGTTSVYQETQSVTTDANGIVSVSIGEGIVVTGDFLTIDWGGNPHFLKVEIDTGSGFADFGTSELKYVPYAKYAENVGSVNFSNITNVPSGLADGDDNTQLTDAQIAAMGYIKSANDADHDASNELQTLTFNNGTRELTITNGNSVTIPAGSSSTGDGWGTQTAATNTSINGDGTSANPLGVNTSDTAFNGWDKNAADDVTDLNGLSDAKTNSVNLFLGNNAGTNNTGLYNTSVGISSLNDITSGGYNTALGYYALENKTTGEKNVGVGMYALRSNSTGNDNTAIGYQTGYNNNGSGNVFIGNKAGYNEHGNNKLYIANSDTTTPLIHGDFSSNELTVNGSLGIKDGTEATGKVFTSDANGKGSWQTPIDNDTQLTDTQITAMGYIKNANDADHDTTNELQTISKNASNVVALSDGGGSFTDDVLTETEVDNYVSNNGYLTTATLPDQTDDDFYKAGTTSPSNNINDNIFHMGRLAIGKNTFDSGTTNGDAQLEVLSENTSDPSYAIRLKKVADEASLIGILKVEGEANGTFGFVGYSSRITGSGTGYVTGISNSINVPNDESQIGIFNGNHSSGNNERIGLYNQLLSGNDIIKGVYNKISSAGTGIQIGVHSELNGGNGKHFGTLNHLYGSNSGKQYGTVNHIENTGDGNHFGTTNEMSGTGAGDQYAIINEFKNASSDGNKYGVYTSIDDNSGNGEHYGTYNTLTGNGTAKHLGTFNNLEGDASNILGGVYNNINGTASTMQYGVSNILSGSGAGLQYGTTTSINNTNNQEHYGSYNLLIGGGSGIHYGNFSWLTGSGAGKQYGTYNKFDGTGNGSKFGSKNEFNTANGTQYGNYVSFSENTSKSMYANYAMFTGAGTSTMGMYNYFNNPGGTGTKWGVNNKFKINTNASVFGFYNYIEGTGLGHKYGIYSNIPSTTGGKHYGVYSKAEKSGSYAGYFVGSIIITKNSAFDDGHLTLTETGDATDGARIMFANSEEENNVWTLWGKADDTSADGTFNFHYTGTGNVLTLKGNGNVGIGRNPATNRLEVNGSASKSTAGSWLGNSDRRLKTNINTIDPNNALQKIRMLRGVTYEWNDYKTGNKRPSGIQYGFIAQELMQVFPSKVSKDNLGYYQTAYGDYDPLFVQAIKALDKKVKEVEKLKTEVDELKTRLDRLEKLLKK